MKLCFCNIMIGDDEWWHWCQCLIYKKKHIALERHNRNNLALNQGNLETEKKNTSNGTRWKEFRIRGCRLQISAEHYGGNRWGKHPNIQCHLAQSWLWIANNSGSQQAIAIVWCGGEVKELQWLFNQLDFFIKVGEERRDSL